LKKKILKNKKKGTASYIILILAIAEVYLIFIGFIFMFRKLDVNDYILTQISQIVSKKLKTKVSIKDFGLTVLPGFYLSNITIYDLNNDTLVHLGKVDINMPLLNTKHKKIKAYQVDIDTIYFQEHIDSLGRDNLMQWLKNFRDTTHTQLPSTKSKSWTIDVNRILAGNMHLKYYYDTAKTSNNHFNPNHIEIKNGSFDIQNFQNEGNYLSLLFNRLSFKEKSGLNLNNFKSEINISPYEITLKNAQIKLKNSNIGFTRIELIPKAKNKFADLLTKGKIRIYSEKGQNNFANPIDFKSIIPGLPYQKIYFHLNSNGNLKKLTIYDFKSSIDYQNSIFLSADIYNITDINKIRFKIKQFYLKLNSQTTAFKKTIKYELPQWTDTLGLVNIAGNLSGNLKNIAGNIQLNSLFGKSNLNFKMNNLPKKLKIEGKLVSNNLKAYKLSFSPYDSISLNSTNKFKLELKDSTLNYALFGKIDSIYLQDKFLDSLSYSIVSQDNKIKINAMMNNFYAAFNIKSSINIFQNQYNIKNNIKIPRLNLEAIMANPDYYTKILSISNIKSDIHFSGIDDFTGFIQLSYFNLKSLDNNFKINEFYLKSDTLGSKKTIKIYSDFLNAKLSGKFLFSEIYPAAKKTVQRYMPTIFGLEKPEKNQNAFYSPGIEDFIDVKKEMRFNIRFKEFNKLTNEFIPDLYFSPNTSISGFFKSDLQYLKLNILSDSIQFQNFKLNNLMFNAQTVPNNFYISTSSDELKLPNNWSLKGFTSDWYLHNDTAKMNFAWDNYKSKNKYAGDINLKFISQQTDSNNVAYFLNIKNNELTIKDSLWQLLPANIRLDSTRIQINNFGVISNEQQITTNGIISENKDDKIKVNFNHFSLNNINQIIAPWGLKTTGTLNGYISLQNLYKSPLIFANDTITKFKINNQKIGETYIELENKDNENVFINIFAQYGIRLKTNTLQISGKYNLLTQKIDIPKLKIYHIKLNLIQSLVKGIASDIGGYVNADMKVKGTISKPELKGNIVLAKSRLTVDYFNLAMSFSDTIHVYPDRIEFNNFTLHQAQNKATVNGEIKYSPNFENINFDIKLLTNNFKFLNTIKTDSSFFYGTANLSAEAKVSGNPNDINMEINATTNKNTKFNIPLISESEISETPFVQFENSKKFHIDEEKQQAISKSLGMNIDLTIHATPDAEVQLIFDEKVGDIIKASGEGNIKILINPNGDLNMYGDYEVYKGDYMFTLGNTINKKFEIGKGGLIRWNGNPYNAELNLNALYNVKRVSLYDLTFDNNDKETKIPAECKLQMTNTLEHPHIAFGIDMPTAGEDLVQQLTSLPTDELNKQILSLLIFNKFQPLPGYKQESAPSQQGVEINTTEMLTNQISHWLSQISNDFDIGINYQSGDSLGGSELELEVSTQLLNERLIINSNIGVTSNNPNQQNNQSNQNFVGDMEIEYKIDKAGKFRAKAFTKTNNQQLNYEQTPYSYGVGIFYRHEFDHLFNKKKEK